MVFCRSLLTLGGGARTNTANKRAGAAQQRPRPPLYVCSTARSIGATITSKLGDTGKHKQDLLYSKADVFSALHLRETSEIQLS